MTEYTAKEVFAEANRHGDHVADMLTAYAERIEADKVAADYPECSGDPSSCPENEGHGCCKPNPPAQAAQVDLQKVFDALHRSSPLPEIIRHVPGAERLHHEAHAMVRDALAAQSIAEPVAQGELTDRTAFEQWLIGVHGYSPSDLIWQESRNCYADYGMHLAWKAWQEATPPAQPAERVVVRHKTFHTPERGFWHEPLFADEAQALWASAEANDAQRAKVMPDEESAIRLMFEAGRRLKDFGWNDAIYCPKDRSEFLALEFGSTGKHPCIYEGEWPSGSWWIVSDGDMSPSRPVLWKPITAAQQADR